MNKVSLAEAGDGSPPFYLKNRCIKVSNTENFAEIARFQSAQADAKFLVHWITRYKDYMRYESSVIKIAIRSPDGYVPIGAAILSNRSCHHLVVKGAKHRNPESFITCSACV